MKLTKARDTDINPEKFKELLLYIAKKTEGDPTFGAIRMNKALFFADMFAFGRFGKSITGAEYQKLEHGPAPRSLLPLRKELIDAGDAVIAPRNVGGQTQHRLVHLREPNLSEFSGQEIALVDESLSAMSGMTAARVSNISHLIVECWNELPERETIPLEIVFIELRDLTEEERQHAAALEVTSGR